MGLAFQGLISSGGDSSKHWSLSVPVMKSPFLDEKVPCLFYFHCCTPHYPVRDIYSINIYQMNDSMVKESDLERNTRGLDGLAEGDLIGY